MSDIFDDLDFNDLINNSGREYYLRGNTYQIKEDLKAHACVWCPGQKAWKTPPIIEGEMDFKLIESLATAVGAQMYPIELSEECQKIQDILRN